MYVYSFAWSYLKTRGYSMVGHPMGVNQKFQIPFDFYHWYYSLKREIPKNLNLFFLEIYSIFCYFFCAIFGAKSKLLFSRLGWPHRKVNYTIFEKSIKKWQAPENGAKCIFLNFFWEI